MVEEEPAQDKETTTKQETEDTKESTSSETGNVSIRVEEPDHGMLNIPPNTLTESSSSETLMGKGLLNCEFSQNSTHFKFLFYNVQQ